MAKKEKLTPPDRKQCQAFPNQLKWNPWSVGGAPRQMPVRCSNKPTWIAKETKPGEDGQRGSMSLCEECKVLCEKHRKNDGITYRRIK